MWDVIPPCGQVERLAGRSRHKQEPAPHSARGTQNGG